MQNIWFVKIHRKIRDNPIFWKPNYLAVFMYIILEVEFQESKRVLRWDIINLKAWEWLFFQKEIADKMWISLWTVSNVIKKLNSENIIEIKTCSKYSIIGLINWEVYQTQVENTIENELKTKWKPIENELKHLKNTKKTKNTKEDISNDIWEQALEPIKEYWDKEINKTLEFIQRYVWCDTFAESNKLQRQYGRHIFNLWKKIWSEEMKIRLDEILSDKFKAKNCNKIAYIYKELKSFIHSPQSSEIAKF